MKKTLTRTTISDRIAVPRRPPQGEPTAGSAPYFRGPNVLADPGFENFVAISGGWNHRNRPSGVNDYAIPYMDLSCPSYLRWPSGDCATGSFPLWAQTSGPYNASGIRSDQAWKVSTANPHSGSYGAAWWNWSNGDIPPGELCPFSPYINAPFSARVEPGDSVTFSMWFQANWSQNDNIQPNQFNYGKALIILRFYTSSFLLLSVVNGTEVLLGEDRNNPWEQATASTVAPPGSYYIRSCAAFSDSRAGVVYADDAVLAVL